ncbi:integrase core domain-containing protein [Patescibacteria group bacterium]|nr:integrase core domain-containing protein [Patescibacteria group bacterium]
MPKARMHARNDVVWRGLSMQAAALKYGVNRSTVWRWVKRAKKLKLNGNSMIDTLPSRPKYHPNQLSKEIVNRIVLLRTRLGRCAPVIHAHMQQEGFKVSLSSVERTLRRKRLTRKKKQAKDYVFVPKPDASFPGCLIQMDTIHFVYSDFSRTYIYAVIDLYSRLGYAEYHTHINHQTSLQVILNAQKYFGFKFHTIQTDHGSEFSPSLSYLLRRKNIVLRHSRVRKPNDNAHVERFNRTIQEECLKGRLPDENIQRQLKNYLVYYNHRRLHLSLNLLTPTQFVAKVLT